MPQEDWLLQPSKLFTFFEIFRNGLLLLDQDFSPEVFFLSSWKNFEIPNSFLLHSKSELWCKNSSTKEKLLVVRQSGVP